MLRDPVERAISNYRWSVSNGMEDEDFATAIALEDEREATLEPRLRYARPLSYVSRGRYAELLRPWLDLFPREQVAVVRFEDLVGDTAVDRRRPSTSTSGCERRPELAGADRGCQFLERRRPRSRRGHRRTGCARSTLRSTKTLRPCSGRSSDRGDTRSDRCPNERQVVVVTPVFNEEEGLEAYAEHVTRVLLDDPDTDFRVDPRRRRQHRPELGADQRASARGTSRFRGVRLSRNFGSHVALSAGFAHVDADASAAATLACDLQDPPETILEFVEKWRAGADIVWGQRLSRQDSGWKVATSKLFNRALTKHAMPQGSKFTTGSFLLVDRVVLDCFNEFKEHNRITFALVAWTGFDQVRVPYHRVARTTGTSGWSFPKMLKSMYDAFIGLSTLPIRVMKWAAALALLLAVLLIVYTVVLAMLTQTQAPGWASQMIVVAGFFAVQFTLMAIVGEYLNRIYTESMRRPFFFVSRRHRPSRVEPHRRGLPPGALQQPRRHRSGGQGQRRERRLAR